MREVLAASGTGTAMDGNSAIVRYQGALGRRLSVRFLWGLLGQESERRPVGRARWPGWKWTEVASLEPDVPCRSTAAERAASFLARQGTLLRSTNKGRRSWKTSSGMWP